MQNVAIFEIVSPTGETAFRAVAGDSQSEGRTAGEALDGVALNLAQGNGEALVLIRGFRPDSLFTADQHCRLDELMQRWRAARDAGQALPTAEQGELDSLVAAELAAAKERTERILQGAGK